MAATVCAMTTWLQAFATWPAPLSPTWTMFRPIDLSSGNTRSKAATVPPTITDRVPSIAPCCPPDTGASSISTPFARSISAIRRVTDGEIVLLSTTTMPGRAPCTTPAGPSTTSSTSGVSDTLVNTNSACSATSRGEPQAVAPAVTSGAMVSARRP